MISRMNNKPQNSGLSYQDAGVNIDEANRLVGDIKQIAKRTMRPGVLAGIGGFGALFEVPTDRYKEPVLVSGTDGVGTKLKLAMALNNHNTIGIDLVAMCVNDIITLGAEPLFFLDYYATGHLNTNQAATILSGIGIGCEQAGAALIGGETAEMPGMYHGDEYDLAGFCVGVVEKSKIIDGSRIKPGDALLGLASSGPHSNGYSLIRRVLELNETDLKSPLNGSTIGETLIVPTKIYVKSLLALAKSVNIKALAHITGGGIIENLPRVMPAHMQADIQLDAWQPPEIFHWLQTRGNIADAEMFRTFNMGIGMVICLDPKDVGQAIQVLEKHNETVFKLGSIQSKESEQPHVNLI